MLFDAKTGVPPGPVAFASPAWHALFKHTVAEAARLGLEVDMNNDASWTGSGGPWITPELAMQRIVWTETAADGPKRLHTALRQPETVAGYYRDIAVLAFPTPPADADPKAKTDTQIKTGCRIDHLKDKIEDGPDRKAIAAPTQYRVLPADAVVAGQEIIDLSGRLGPDGQLTWEVPAGHWTILRIGYTPTGAVNAPSPAAGEGLECDKLSKQAMDVHFAGLMSKLIADAGPAAGKTLVSTHIDSWEVGFQNWTPRMPAEFRRLRGYDLKRFLPAITGRVVDSLEVSERFLWDLRKTIAELLAENYAGRMRELAHRHRLGLSIEAYGVGPMDNFSYARMADVPMCEVWNAGDEPGNRAIKAMKLGRPRLREADLRRRGIHLPGLVLSLDRFSVGHEGPGRRDVLRWGEPLRFLQLRPPAVARPEARHDGVQLRHSLRADRDLVAVRAAVARVSDAVQRPVAAGPLCGRRLLPPDRGRAQLLRLPAADHRPAERRPGRARGDGPGEIRLRRLSGGSRVDSHGRRRRPDGAARRHELPAPGPATGPNDDARAVGKNQRPGRGGGDGCRSPARPVAEPERFSGVRPASQASRGGALGRLRRRRTREHRFGAAGWFGARRPKRCWPRWASRPISSASRLPARSAIFIAAGAKRTFTSSPTRAPRALEAHCTFRVAGKRPAFWHPDTGLIEPAVVYRPTSRGTQMPVALGPCGSVFVVFRPEGDAMAGDRVDQLTRDGRPVLTAGDERRCDGAAGRIAVERAVYGVPAQLGPKSRCHGIGPPPGRSWDRGHLGSICDAWQRGAGRDEDLEGRVHDRRPSSAGGEDRSRVHAAWPRN